MAETTVDTLPPSEPPQPRKGAFERVIGVFFEPTATFEDVARAPSFLLPLILSMIAAGGVGIMSVQKLDLEQVARQQIMKSPAAADLPKEQIEQRAQIGAKISRYVYYCIPLFVPLGTLVFSGLWFLMANFIFGGKATYKQLFAVQAYAQMPGLIFTILAIMVLFIKDPADIDVQNMVASNLGALISDETSKIGHSIGKSMDIFSFWQGYLISKGISAAARLSFGKALAAVIIPWALFVLIGAGFSAFR